MGDSKRTSIVSSLGKRIFPKAKRVANIACGNTELSFKQVVGFDKKKTKRGLKRDSSNLSFKKGEFDLVVGIHPDGATWDCIRLAKESACAFIILPCCVCPPEGIKIDRPWDAWLIREAKKMGFRVEKRYLRMSGKNLTIIGYLTAD